jgi:hypothetical protein
MQVRLAQTAMRVRHPKSVRPARSAWRISDISVEIFILALGVLSSVVFHFVGDLFVTEIIMIVSLPFFLIFYARRLLVPRFMRVFALLGLWLCAQVISDAYNHTVLLDRMRGMALIGFFAIEIAFFAMFIAGNERRKTIFLTAYAIGSVVLSRFQPNIAEAVGDSTDKWKWGYAFGVTMLALVASAFLVKQRRRILAFLLLLGIAAIDLLTNFRSAFLELLVATVLAFPIIPERIGSLRLLPEKNILLRVALVAMLAVAGGWSADQLVYLVSQAGLAGEQAQQKNESQAQAGNLLLGGRPEFFVGLRAAMDNPIVGHGSWAKDMKYIEMQHDMMAEFGMQHDLSDAEADSQGLIPSHSHIIGAWVFSGFCGALFWAYIEWLALRAIVVAAVQRPPLALMYLWLLVGFTWNIFFSPFGSTSRIIEAFTVVVIVDLLQKSPVRNPKSVPWRRRGAIVAPRVVSSHAR